MAINYFTFNGVSSLSKGLYISGGATFNAPEKDYEVVSVPGRNGDLLIDNGRFNNVTLTYPSIIIDHYEQNAADIRNWLLSTYGYARLEDTYHPDEYRMAYFVGPIEMESYFLEAGSCDIDFVCKPQRFLKDGDQVIKKTTFPFTVYNHGYFDSSPNIFIKRSSADSENIFNVNHILITVNHLCPKQYILFNCDKRTVYGFDNENDMLSLQNPTNVSSYIVSNSMDFPKFKVGENTIATVCTNIDYILYQGKWWRV